MAEIVARTSARLKTAFANFWSGSSVDRAYRVALLSVLAFGIVLRLIGQVTSPPSLWMDEALWAERLLQKSPFAHGIRPFGFMGVVKLLASWFGPNEFWLRFVSNCAAMLALLLMAYLATRLLKSRSARLLLVFLFALHPALIDLGKEFKPYSLEVLVHLVPIVLFVKFRETGRKRWLYAMLVSLPLLFPLAYNVAFAYPGLLLLALYFGYRSSRWRGIVPSVSVGVACIAVLAVTYVSLLRNVTSDRAERYWGRKYDVFYDPRAAARPAKPPSPRVVESEETGDQDEPDETARLDLETSRIAWLSEKYADVAAMPGIRRRIWEVPKSLARFASELGALDRLFWIGMHLAGIALVLLRRRYDALMLFVVPILAVVVANALGQWPFGAFRTNAFLCVYLLPLAALVLDEVALAGRSRLLALAIPILVLTVLPGFAFGFDWHRQKHVFARNHQQRELLELLRTEREEHLRVNPSRPPEALLLDPHTFESQDFYLKYHPTVSVRQRAFFKQNFKQANFWGFPGKVKRELPKRLKQDSWPVWIVVSKAQDMASVRDYVRREGRVVFERYLGGDHMVLLVASKQAQDAR